jgi:hypothetical protein
MADAAAGGTPTLELSQEVSAALLAELPRVAEQTIDAVIAEVPSYANAWEGPMGRTIRSAVQLALGGFVNLAGHSRTNPGTPAAPAMEAAYALGRGEARSGRSMDALLAAYRIGARTAWRDMSAISVEHGLTAVDLAAFAEMVFAYIDELSASSAAGHTDELETTGRVRRRYLERLSQALLTGAPADAVVAAAGRAEWDPPEQLTAVLLPQQQVRAVLGLVDSRTLQPTEDIPGLDDLEERALLLVADQGRGGARARAALLRLFDGHSAVVGPTRPWLDVAASYDRVLRYANGAAPGEQTIDTEAHLAEIVLGADPGALADLRAQVLAPLSALRPSAAEKLTETLRCWLLHHGRRDDMAAALFVHPQTVRYRMGQLREVYADRLEDPQFVLEATLALALAGD